MVFHVLTSARCKKPWTKPGALNISQGSWRDASKMLILCAALASNMVLIALLIVELSARILAAKQKNDQI